MSHTESVAKTIRFPADVVEAIRPFINNNTNFSNFVIDAIRNHIRMLKYREGIAKSFAAWNQADHPELADGVEIYTEEMRKGRRT